MPRKPSFMNLSAEQIRELHVLLWAQCDGDITRAQQVRLEQLVLRDPQCCEFYVCYMQLHAGLYWDRAGDLAKDVPSGAVAAYSTQAPSCDVGEMGAQPVPPAPLDPPPTGLSQGGASVPQLIARVVDVFRLPQPIAWRVGLIVTAVIIVVVATAWWGGREPDHRDNPRVNAEHVDVALPEFIAKVTGTTDCRWDADPNDPVTALGSHLVIGQRLRLVEGVAEITFHVGAKVLLEGPSFFEINSSTDAFLHSGKLTAKVPERAQGFTVRTPTARVVDLGTEFGVEAEKSGETEVYVFRGLVELVPGEHDVDGASMPGQRLEAGQAQRITAMGHVAARPQLDPGVFARQLWKQTNAPDDDRRKMQDDLFIDFEDFEGRLESGAWYVSGGMNATRLRTDRRSLGEWGLSTDGTSGAPDFVANVKDSVIDGNTSMAWGPFFTVNDTLPRDAKLLVDIAGSGAPWSENVFNGPAGLALWDLAARDFARTPSSEVIFVHPAKNTFDLEPAEIPLAGFEGRTLGIVLVDRRCLHWGWVAVDNMRSTAGALRSYVGRHHRVTIVEDFDDDDSLDRWLGDKDSFQLGRTGTSGQTQGHINHRLDISGALPVGRGYLSSKTAIRGGASRGTVNGPTFVLEGDVLEFYLAGTGDGVAFQMVAVDANGTESVIASATTRSATFTCRYWPINPGWIGRTVYVRLVDEAHDGHIEVDAIRVVEFNVPSEA